MYEQKIGFVGVGNMGQAILGGILRKNLWKAGDVYLYDPFPDQTRAFEKLGCHAVPSEEELCKKAEIIFLCVKPQKMEEALNALRPAVTGDKLFVTIAAGISTGFIQKVLGGQYKVIRFMPNTPLLIGLGAAAYCYKPPVSDAEAKMIEGIFAALGVVERLDESKLSPVTAVNGSAPAYIYYVIEAMQRYALSQGIDEKQAKRLVCATVIGAASMALQSEESLQTLIDRVTSPGGTTLEAMKVLKQEKMDEIIIKAMGECTRRAFELEK